MRRKINVHGNGYAGIASLLGIYVVFGFAQASNEFRVLFLESIGMSATDCGRILAFSGLLVAVSRPLAGGLADKLRSRRVIYIFSLLLWMGILVLMLFMKNVRLAGFLLCAGIVPFLSVSEPVTYGMVEASDVQATVQNPNLDFSIIRVCLSIGYSLINFLYTPIVNCFGSSAPFACTLIFVGIMLAFSGSLRRFETTSARQGKQVDHNRLQLGRLFRNYYLITFVLLNFVLALGSNTQNYIYYLIESIGLDGSLIGVAIGIRVMGEIIIMPLIPLVKKRVSLPMLIACGCGFRVLQMILFIVCKNPPIIMFGTMLNGFAAGISLSSTAVYLRMMAPEGLDTTTLSLSTVMTNLGAIIVNLFSGVMVDTLGILSVYRISLVFLLLWIVLYFGAWTLGVCVLKKEPPMPMFLPRNEK